MLLESAPHRPPAHRRLPFWPVLVGLDAACGLVMVLLGVLVAGAAGAVAAALGVAVLVESGLLAVARRASGRPASQLATGRPARPG
jgi:hypothetical protein